MSKELVETVTVTLRTHTAQLQSLPDISNTHTDPRWLVQTVAGSGCCSENHSSLVFYPVAILVHCGQNEIIIPAILESISQSPALYSLRFHNVFSDIHSSSWLAQAREEASTK